MKITKTYKCVHCGKAFTSTYDSRNHQLFNYAQCLCGKARIHCTGPTSFFLSDCSIKDFVLSAAGSIAFGKGVIEYPEDFLNLTEENKILLQKIKDVGNALEDEAFTCFYDGSSEKEIFFSLEGADGRESVSITFKDSLFCEYGFSEEEMGRRNERINVSANRFLTLVEKILKGELDIDNPRRIWNDETLEWHSSRKEPVQLFDYYLLV